MTTVIRFEDEATFGIPTPNVYQHPFKYADGAPDWYRCRGCHATGCRLWHAVVKGVAWSNFYLCLSCVEGIDGSPPTIDALTGRTGGRPPVIPREDGKGYLGLRDDQEAYLWWWKSLRLTPSTRDLLAKMRERGGA